ncbi:MAG: FAD binding domain-containing protein [Chitinophagaceae bacterium]|nr:FAD binding domain-containing protein [Chitinophagaceae bacterium]
MKPFNFIQPHHIKDAIKSKKRDAQYLAGGTNLADLMKKNITQPDTLIDINKTDISDTIEKKGQSIIIGALVKNASVAENLIIKEHAPLLSKAILAGASQQIRNMATVGGNLLQKNRCPYFYDTTAPCNKRNVNSGCSAVNGDTRYTALVGYTKDCIAVFPSDMAVALSIYNAKIHCITKEGENQSLDIHNFYCLTNDNPIADNILPVNAIITSIEISIPFLTKNNSYVKLRDRDAYAFALVSVAAALDVKDDTIVEARLSSGGIAHKPWRWYEAEKFLVGKNPSFEIYKETADLIVKGINPPKTSTFKIPLLRGAIETALMQAINL